MPDYEVTIGDKSFVLTMDNAPTSSQVEEIAKQQNLLKPSAPPSTFKPAVDWAKKPAGTVPILKFQTGEAPWRLASTAQLLKAGSDASRSVPDLTLPAGARPLNAWDHLREVEMNPEASSLELSWADELKRRRTQNMGRSIVPFQSGKTSWAKASDDQIIAGGGQDPFRQMNLIGSNPQATPQEKVWAGEYKRRFRERAPEQLTEAQRNERANQAVGSRDVAGQLINTVGRIGNYFITDPILQNVVGPAVNTWATAENTLAGALGLPGRIPEDVLQTRGKMKPWEQTSGEAVSNLIPAARMTGNEGTAAYAAKQVAALPQAIATFVTAMKAGGQVAPTQLLGTPLAQMEAQMLTGMAEAPIEDIKSGQYGKAAVDVAVNALPILAHGLESRVGPLRIKTAMSALESAAKGERLSPGRVRSTNSMLGLQPNVSIADADVAHGILRAVDPVAAGKIPLADVGTRVEVDGKQGVVTGAGPNGMRGVRFDDGTTYAEHRSKLTILPTPEPQATPSEPAPGPNVEPPQEPPVAAAQPRAPKPPKPYTPVMHDRVTFRAKGGQTTEEGVIERITGGTVRMRTDDGRVEVRPADSLTLVRPFATPKPAAPRAPRPAKPAAPAEAGAANAALQARDAAYAEWKTARAKTDAIRDPDARAQAAAAEKTLWDTYIKASQAYKATRGTAETTAPPAPEAAAPAPEVTPPAEPVTPASVKPKAPVVAPVAAEPVAPVDRRVPAPSVETHPRSPSLADAYGYIEEEVPGARLTPEMHARLKAASDARDAVRAEAKALNPTSKSEKESNEYHAKWEALGPRMTAADDALDATIDEAVAQAREPAPVAPAPELSPVKKARQARRNRPEVIVAPPPPTEGATNAPVQGEQVPSAGATDVRAGEAGQAPAGRGRRQGPRNVETVGKAPRAPAVKGEAQAAEQGAPEAQAVAVPTAVTDAASLSGAMQTHFGLPKDQADAVGTIADARAETWAKVTGKPAAEWYSRIKVGKGPAGENALYQAGKPWYYLKSERVVSEKMPARMMAEAARAFLMKQGVKPEEMKWLGIDDLLAKGGMVSKADLLRHIAENDIGVREVLHGEQPTPEQSVEYQRRVREIERLRDNGGQITHDDARRRIQALRSEMGIGSANPKWTDLTTSGGTAYRELLFILGGRKVTDAEIDAAFLDRGVTREGLRALIPWQREQMRQQLQSENGPDFQTSHWDEANILAHVRFDERTGPNGEKVLHVAEIQSDWHQAGRRKGYAGAKVVERSDGFYIQNPDGTVRLPEEGPFGSQKLAELALGHYEKSAVPQAPFSKTWHELAAKRILAYAAEHGYDRVSWDPGSVQADRYDLRKRIGELAYWKDGDQYTISAVDPEGRSVLDQDIVDANKLEDVVGKDVANRMLNGEGSDKSIGFLAEGEGVKFLSGEGLAIGGEGMVGFYDRILPDTFNKLGKPFGARVEQSEIRVEREYDEHGAKNLYPDRLPVPSIPITPDMRSAATSEGFPLFQGERASTERGTDNVSVIRALQNPDVSSAVHELAHVFRTDLEEQAAVHGPSKADLGVVAKWAGADGEGGWTRDAEERFARGFERYMRDGQAPLPALKRVFAQFKEWLTAIYSNVTGSAIAGKVSPEVRGVFDRLLGKAEAEPAPAEGTHPLNIGVTPTEAPPTATEPEVGSPYTSRGVQTVMVQLPFDPDAPSRPNVIIERVRGGSEWIASMVEIVPSKLGNPADLRQEIGRGTLAAMKSLAIEKMRAGDRLDTSAPVRDRWTGNQIDWSTIDYDQRPSHALNIGVTPRDVIDSLKNVGIDADAAWQHAVDWAQRKGATLLAYAKDGVSRFGEGFRKVAGKVWDAAKAFHAEVAARQASPEGEAGITLNPLKWGKKEKEPTGRYVNEEEWSRLFSQPYPGSPPKPATAPESAAAPPNAPEPVRTGVVPDARHVTPRSTEVRPAGIPSGFTFAKNMTNQAERLELGQEPMTKPEREHWSEVQDRVVKAGIIPQAYDIADAAIRTHEHLGDEQVLAILMRKAQVLGAWEKATSDAQKVELEHEFDVLSRAKDYAGTDSAKALGIRRMGVERGYSELELRQSVRKAMKREPTAQEAADAHTVAQAVTDAEAAAKSATDTANRVFQEQAEQTTTRGKPSTLPKDKDGLRAALDAMRKSGKLYSAAKTVQGPQAGAVDVGGTQVNPDVARAIWRYAKTTYIDQGGMDFLEVTRRVADDLGLDQEDVYHVFAGPKTAPKEVTTAMWAAQARRRDAIRNAKAWEEAAGDTKLQKALKAAWEFPRQEAVFGHGGVGMITHAGTSVFIPEIWPIYWRNFFRQWKYTLSGVRNPITGKTFDNIHERMMQRLERPEALEWQRAGLATRPDVVYDTTYTLGKLFGSVGAAGNRGMDVLKNYRDDLAPFLWNKMSAEFRNDPNGENHKLIADIVNHITGYEKLGKAGVAGPYMFAPALESARWARTLHDPYATARDLLNPNASPGAKEAARLRIRLAAQFVGVYGTALLANQALLKVTKQDETVNFTDPTKSDFMSFKWHGRTPTIAGNIFGPLIYLSRVTKTLIEGQGRPFNEVGKITWQYMRMKATPAVGITIDMMDRADFMGRRLPTAPKVTAAGHARLEDSDKPTYTWTEYALSKSPIPMAEYTREVYTELRNAGMDMASAKQLLKSALFLPPALIGVRVGEAPKPFSKKGPSGPDELSKQPKTPNDAFSSGVKLSSPL